MNRRRRPRHTPAVAAAWSVGAVALAADTAALAVPAAHDSTAALMAVVALAYLSVLALGQALAYGCSLAWHAGRPHRRVDRPVLPPSQRSAYTLRELTRMRQAAQDDTLAYARQMAATDAPVRDGLTQPLPTVTRAAWSGVVTGPTGLPWTAPVAEPVGGGR